MVCQFKLNVARVKDLRIIANRKIVGFLGNNDIGHDLQQFNHVLRYGFRLIGSQESGELGQNSCLRFKRHLGSIVLGSPFLVLFPHLEDISFQIWSPRSTNKRSSNSCDSATYSYFVFCREVPQDCKSHAHLPITSTSCFLLRMLIVSRNSLC